MDKACLHRLIDWLDRKIVRRSYSKETMRKWLRKEAPFEDMQRGWGHYMAKANSTSKDSNGNNRSLAVDENSPRNGLYCVTLLDWEGRCDRM